MSKEPRKELSADYLGYHVEDLIPKKVRKKKFTHPIFIYSTEDKLDQEMFDQLYQVVNVYEHSLEDFEFNARAMISLILVLANVFVFVYILVKFLLIFLYSSSLSITQCSLFQS